jgi:hypothetical protein
VIPVASKASVGLPSISRVKICGGSVNARSYQEKSARSGSVAAAVRADVKWLPKIKMAQPMVKVSSSG